MNVDAYLSRIHFSGLVAPTLETLQGLHQAHLLAIPFENLDIHWGRPIRLDEESLFNKIVAGHRGGFCYELNGLFGMLLRQLGFDVSMLSARVFNTAGKLGPEYDHLALMVNLERRWLADVGFGDSSMTPLDLDVRGPQSDGRRQYHIEERAGFWYVARLDDDSRWKDDFQFTLHPREMSEFEAICLYHQTSPDSPFTQRQVCSIATPNGRITFRGLPIDMKVITTVDDSRSEVVLTDPAEVASMLKDQFGIAP